MSETPPVYDFKKRKIPAPKRRMVNRTKPAPPPTPLPQTLNLGVRHTINGHSFGPGVCEVPAELVQIILENEQKNAAEERGLTTRRAFMIGAGNRAIPVAPETFDDPGAMMGLPSSINVQGG